MSIISQSNILKHVYTQMFSQAFPNSQTFPLKDASVLTKDLMEKKQQNKDIASLSELWDVMRLREVLKTFSLRGEDWVTACKRDFGLHVSAQEAQQVYAYYTLAASSVALYQYVRERILEINHQERSRNSAHRWFSFEDHPFSELSKAVMKKILNYLEVHIWDFAWAQILYRVMVQVAMPETVHENQADILEVYSDVTETMISANPQLSAYLLFGTSEKLTPAKVKKLLNFSENRPETETPILYNVDLKKLSSILTEPFIDPFNVLLGPIQALAVNYRLVCQSYFNTPVHYYPQGFISDYLTLAENVERETVLSAAIYWNAEMFSQCEDENAFIFLGYCAHVLKNSQALNVLKDLMIKAVVIDEKIRELYKHWDGMDTVLIRKIENIFEANPLDLISELKTKTQGFAYGAEGLHTQGQFSPSPLSTSGVEEKTGLNNPLIANFGNMQM